MLPWSVVLTYLSVANVVNGDAAEDVSTAQGKLEYLWNTLLIYWCFLGPLGVAGHYFVKGMRAPNKTSEAQ